MGSTSILDVDRVQNVLQRRCESMGVTLTWSEYASTASTNGKNITIPTLHHPVTSEAMDKLYGFVIHESGHHTRPEAFEIMKAVEDPNEALFALFNIMEDDGMEREVANKWGGDAIGLGKSNSVILDEITEEWGKIEWPNDMTEKQVAPLSVCGLGQLSRCEWDGVSNGARHRYFEALPPEAQALMSDLVKEGWVERMQATVTPHDTWDLAVDLYKRLGFDEDETAEEARAQGHSKVPAPPKEQGQGEDEREGDGPPAGEMVETDEDPQGGQGQVVSWKDAVLSEHNEWQAKEDGAPPGNIGIDWRDYQKGNTGLMPAHMVNVMDCRGKQFKVQDEDTYWSHCGSPESFLPDNREGRVFGNRIRRYLQAKRRTRVKRETYHGRLDKSSLTKLALPPVDGGEWNKRLFYQHQDRQELNTCIHVLTDWSGSMDGNKMIYAADASARLVHVFDRILKVPVQLAAFTNGRTPCDIGLMKKFSDKSMSPQKLAENFSKFYKFSSANNDADSVMWAYRQLLARKEQRKILIVLSDGCPAGSYTGSSHSNLKAVTKAIEMGGRVEIWGVGICSDAVSEYYTNHKVLHSSKEINNTLFDIIKQGAYK